MVWSLQNAFMHILSFGPHKTGWGELKKGSNDIHVQG